MTCNFCQKLEAVPNPNDKSSVCTECRFERLQIAAQCMAGMAIGGISPEGAAQKSLDYADALIRRSYEPLV